MRAHLMSEPFDGYDEGFAAVVVSVDDTDDVTRAISTGEIASLIAKAAVALGGYLRLEVTRHQLLLRDDVPYTSHNSSMAFEAFIPCDALDELQEQAVGIIADKRAATSDPGLCIARIPQALARVSGGAATKGNDTQSLSLSETDEWALEQLLAFGRRAKVEFCSIDSAYALAQKIPWVSLSEHGGDGSGVVGALAGVGLRLGGDDGRFRGKWNFSKLCAGEAVLDVGSVSRRLARDFRGPVSLVDGQGISLPSQVPFSLATEAKPILFNGALTVVCDVVDGSAHPCSKIDLGEIGNVNGSWSRVCDAFERDNDEGECFDKHAACKNCLHRRWVAGGFQCVRNRLEHAD